MPPRACVPRLRRWLEDRGARLESVRYPRPAAGGEVQAWRLIPPAPRARAVVVHGGGNDALYPQVALFRALVERGIEVFAFDLDGHGAASTTRFSPSIVRTALAAAVEQAERGRPGRPLHLVGHSFGGSLVLDALASDAVPRAVSAVAISAPTTVELTFGVALAELRGFLRPSTRGQRAHYGWWGMVPAAGPLKRSAYPIRGVDASGARFAYVAAIRELLTQLDLERTAAAITTPVLLVYGTADRLVPPEQGRRLAARIRSAELAEIPGATHWSTAFAGDTITRAADWLDAHTRDAAQVTRPALDPEPTAVASNEGVASRRTAQPSK